MEKFGRILFDGNRRIARGLLCKVAHFQKRTDRWRCATETGEYEESYCLGAVVNNGSASLSQLSK
jgi:hypothetical protein